MARRIEWTHLVTHLAKLTFSLLVLLAWPHPVVGLVAAVSFFLAGFALTHDLAHGALGLPRTLNELALSLAAQTNLVSGHTMRRLHARHHARPLVPDDVEGAGATMSVWQALRIGPRNALRYRLEGLKGARGAERAWVIGETLLSVGVVLVVLVTAHVAALTWVVTCLALQATMALWASHLPHRPPALLVSLARHLEWTHSAVIASFLHHGAHHARPWVPCGALAGRDERGRPLGLPSAASA
ncbi:MAG: fatty acid desaturase [Myxococcaceae bacterium]|jgi:fatty acid desaturase|nr:fatty acid desaturase [Myxococcaceae bacterium]